MELKDLGWDLPFEDLFQSFAEAGLEPARVIAEHRGGYRIHSAQGETAAEVSGKFRHQVKVSSDYPAVGDWVAAKISSPAGKATIQAVLPRRTKISRTTAGDCTDEQVLAANVDHVFIVASLSGALNLRRIERFLMLAWQSGAQPTVVLTKADLCPDPASQVGQVASMAARVAVHAVSSVTGQGMEALGSILQRARTGALLGPSGVGKTTLVNHWFGEERLEVQPVRETDQRGRHTTKHRQLIRLPSGGLVIDTPGMRELQLWEADQELGDTFRDIEALAVQCRFSDCGHATEPGCAVRRAVEQGLLDAGRLAGYHKLKHEVQHFERKQGRRAQDEESRRLKTLKSGLAVWKKSEAEESE